MRTVHSPNPLISLLAALLCTCVTWAAPAGQDGTLTQSEREVLSGWAGDTRIGLGLEYEHARYDLQAKNYDLPIRLGTANMDTAYARLLIGVTDRFEAWGRLGVTRVKAGDFEEGGTPVYGAGLRLQVWERGPWSWDVGGQVTSWTVEREGSAINLPLPDGNNLTLSDGTVDDVEWLVKTGPAWCQGPWTVRGGLAARYSKGNLNVPASDGTTRGTLSYSLNGEWQAGAYVGATWQFTKTRAKALGLWSPDCSLMVEAGVTGESSYLTAGLILVPSGMRQ